MTNRTLKQLGESLLYQWVYKPAHGHVIDYKIVGKDLIVIVEKKSKELVEGIYKPPWARNPLKENRVQKVTVTPVPPKPPLTCPRCRNLTLPYDGSGKRICLRCQSTGADYIFTPGATVEE
jgi:hypothetical protein